MRTIVQDVRKAFTQGPASLFENRIWLDWKAVSAILLIAVLQFSLSYRLRYCIYIVDDQDPLASGVFFRSVYRTIFDNHLPVQVILSHWWVAIFGASAVSNRMMAASMNVLIETQIFLIGRRINGYLTGVLAALLYLATEANSWAYLNLSELPSVLFALCAISCCLRFSRPEYKVELVRPFWFGVFLSLSVLSRAMAVPMAGFVALLPLLHTGYKERIKRNVLPVIAGAVVPIAVIGSYFAYIGSLNALIYWSILYNFRVHAHPALSAWIGDLHYPGIQQIWIFNTSGLLLVFVGLYLAARNRNAGITRALAVCWLPALGGWLGANPAGIGTMAFHAIPAFPFLCLGFISALTLICTAWTSGWRYATILRWSAIALALVSTYPMFALTANLIYRPPAVWPDYAHASQIGSYIAAHTSPRSRIFVFGTNSLIYVAAHRDSATEFSLVYGGVSMYQDRLLEELQRSKPEAIVFNKSDAWYHSNLTDFPKVVAYILSNYRVSRQFDDVLFKPSAEASEPLVLGPEDLAKFKSAIVNYTWRPVQDILPAGEPQLLSFGQEGEWREVYAPHSINFNSLGNPKELLLELKVLVSGAAHAFDRYPLRILFLGRDGRKLNQFCSTWVPITPDSQVATIHVPLTRLKLCHGDFSWSEVTGVQIGASGPAGGKVALYSLAVFNLGSPAAASKPTMAQRREIVH